MSKGIIRALCAFLLVISNVQRFDRLKYVGLIIILIYIVIGITQDGLEKNRLTFMIVFLIIAISLTIFQPLSISQVINAVFFASVLLLLSLYGSYFLTCVEDIKYYYIGTFAGIIFGMVYNIPLLLRQAAGIGSRVRIYGSFYHPNTLGALASMSIAMLIIMWVWYERRNNGSISIRIFYILNMIIQFFLVRCSDSRGYMILTISYLVIYLLKNISGMRRIIRICVYAVIAVTIVHVGYYFYIYYASTDLSYSSRLEGLMSINLKGIYHWIGYGMVSSSEIDYSVLSAGSMEIAWVKLYYKGGVIYIILYIVLFIALLAKGLSIQNTEKRFVFISVFATFLLGSMVESSIVTIFNANPIFMWMCLGAIPYLEDNYETDIKKPCL